MKRIDKIISIVAIIILITASLGIWFLCNNKEEPNDIIISGLFTEYKNELGYYSLKIDGIWYGISGFPESIGFSHDQTQEHFLVSLLGRQVSFIVHKIGFGVGDYSYVGMISREPIYETITEIKETNILTKDQQSYLDFTNWLENRHPLIFRLLWNRFQRVN
jgi:hypothetical protein